MFLQYFVLFAMDLVALSCSCNGFSCFESGGLLCVFYFVCLLFKFWFKDQITWSEFLFLGRCVFTPRPVDDLGSPQTNQTHRFLLGSGPFSGEISHGTHAICGEEEIVGSWPRSVQIELSKTASSRCSFDRSVQIDRRRRPLLALPCAVAFRWRRGGCGGGKREPRVFRVVFCLGPSLENLKFLRDCFVIILGHCVILIKFRGQCIITKT